MSNPLTSELSRVVRVLLGIAAGVKHLLPKPVQRLVLLYAFGSHRQNAEVAPQANRRCLGEEIIPHLAAQNLTVLFVGTSSYTFHYERHFGPKTYTTIDPNPGQAVWGSQDHIVTRVQDIGLHRPAGSFDRAVLNGVFGYGVNDPPAMRATAQALHDVLRPGGQLIFGWNTDAHAEPETLGVFTGLFARSLEPRRTFAGDTHVYDFSVRQ